MKKLLCLTLMAISAIASAQVSVSGYIKKDGTYVAPHYRTAPNNTLSDNYSTKGNINPYTGEAGTVVNNQSAYSMQQEQARMQQLEELRQRRQQQDYEQQQEVQRQIQQQQQMQQEQLMQSQRLLQMQQLQQIQAPRAPAYNINGGCNPNYPASCIR